MMGIPLSWMYYFWDGGSLIDAKIGKSSQK
jgi:hypothetical protein